MTEFLKPENVERTKKIINQIMNRPDSNIPFIRFWSEEEIQLDGNFSLAELNTITELMENFK
jgi:hypothetical protein